MDTRLLSDLLTAAADAPGSPLPSSEDVPVPIGGLLAWTAASVNAKHAVEVGAHAGITGLCLLRGFDARGILTSIASDPDDHRAAGAAFAGAGVGDRVRSIGGDPLELLARLSDGAYDLVLVGDVGTDQRDVRSHALRLLRPGGALVALGIARSSGSGDVQRARRTFVRDLVDDDRLTVAVLPIHHGVVLARRAD